MKKRYRIDVEVSFWIENDIYRAWAAGDEFDTEAEAEEALRKYLTAAHITVCDTFKITTIYTKA